jgi:ribosomal protein S18 acetylase RimI-like enzyme
VGGAANIAIRTAASSDFAALRAADALAASDPARARTLRRAIDTGECLVACEAADVLGFAIVDHSFYDHGFLRLLVVRESARRRGIGSALVRAAEQRCASTKLFTSTNASNAPMQRLLERLGYARSGTIENLDPGDPEWVYVRVLRSASAAASAALPPRP